jgi:hypothetical protein
VCADREDVRHYFEVSDRNLPERLRGQLTQTPGIQAWSAEGLGTLVHVPANAEEWDRMASQDAPVEIQHVLRRAVELKCSLVAIRADLEPSDDLPTFAGDQMVGPGRATPPPAAPQPAAPQPAGPPPGWYADPSGQARVRYWDGAAWTSHISH